MKAENDSKNGDLDLKNTFPAISELGPHFHLNSLSCLSRLSDGTRGGVSRPPYCASPRVSRTLPFAATPPCQWMCPVLHSTQQKGEQTKARYST